RWSYEYIESLSKDGVINGDDGFFYPENSVTREEFLKMILERLNINLITNDNMSFNDVTPNAWYEKYVATASKLQIVNGVSEFVFGIGENVSREDAAVMLLRGLRAVGKNINVADGKLSFNDSDTINDYAVEAVKSLVNLGIISGNENGEFAPRENLSREEAAKIVYMIGGIMDEK
ncbi:MAG: S-layer homology domain-containing protein, partial [Oscillospiraceae bacterium]